MDTCRERVQELTRLLEDADPVLAKSPEVVQVVSFIKKITSRPLTSTDNLDPCDKFTYADIAAGRVSPSPFSDTSDKKAETPTQLFVTKPVAIKTLAPKDFEEDKTIKEVVSKQTFTVTSEAPVKILEGKQFSTETTENLTTPKLLRRGRSPSRRGTPKDNQSEVSKLPPKPKPRSVDSTIKKSPKSADELESNKLELHTKSLAKRLLAPESIRGRSPSPLYIAGESASYAQMVKSGSRPQSRSGTPDRLKEQMFSLKTTDRSLAQHKPESKPKVTNNENNEEALSAQASVEEPKIDKEPISENWQKPVEKISGKNVQNDLNKSAISPLEQKESPVNKASLKSQKVSGTSSVEKKAEATTVYKDSKQKSQSKSRNDKKQIDKTSTPAEHVARPIIPLQPDIHITDFQSLTPELQYSGAFTDPQGGLHYSPGLFQPYIGPEGEVASFIASGQQLISSGLGTYTTSESYCEQPLFVENSYSVNPGMYSIQQTPDYQSQVFVSNSQGYIPSFGGSHTAYTHLESEPLALTADNDGVSYASILAQGLSGDPHLNQGRLQLQTEAQQWDVPPTCDVSMVMSSVGDDRTSNQEDDVSFKGIKRSKSPLLRNEAVEPQKEKELPRDLENEEDMHGKKTEPIETKAGKSIKVNSSNTEKNTDSQQKKKKQKSKGSAKPAKSQEQSETVKEINLPNQKSQSDLASNQTKEKKSKETKIIPGGVLVNPEEINIEQTSTQNSTNVKGVLEKYDSPVEANDAFKSNTKIKKKGKQSFQSQSQTEKKTLEMATPKTDLPKKGAELDQSVSNDKSKMDTQINKDLDHKTGKSKKKNKQVTNTEMKQVETPVEIDIDGVGGLKAVDHEQPVEKPSLEKETLVRAPSKQKKQSSQIDREPSQKEQSKDKTIKLKKDNKTDNLLETKNPDIRNTKVEDLKKLEKDNNDVNQQSSEGDVKVPKESSTTEQRKVDDQSKKKKKKKTVDKPKNSQSSNPEEDKEAITVSNDSKQDESNQNIECSLTVESDTLSKPVVQADLPEKLSLDKGKLPKSTNGKKVNKVSEVPLQKDQRKAKLKPKRDDDTTTSLEKLTKDSKDTIVEELNKTNNDNKLKAALDGVETTCRDTSVAECKPAGDQSNKKKKKKGVDKPKSSQSGIPNEKESIHVAADQNENMSVQTNVSSLPVKSYCAVKPVGLEDSSEKGGLVKDNSVKPLSAEKIQPSQIDHESVQKEQSKTKSAPTSSLGSSITDSNKAKVEESNKSDEVNVHEETTEKGVTTQKDSSALEQIKVDQSSKKKKKKTSNKPTNHHSITQDNKESVCGIDDIKGDFEGPFKVTSDSGLKPVEHENSSEKSCLNNESSVKVIYAKDIQPDQETSQKEEDKDKSKVNKEASIDVSTEKYPDVIDCKDEKDTRITNNKSSKNKKNKGTESMHPIGVKKMTAADETHLNIILPENSKETNITESPNIVSNLKSEMPQNKVSPLLSETEAIGDESLIEKEVLQKDLSKSKDKTDKLVCSETLHVDERVTQVERKSKIHSESQPKETHPKKKKTSKQLHDSPKAVSESVINNPVISPQVKLDFDNESSIHAASISSIPEIQTMKIKDTERTGKDSTTAEEIVIHELQDDVSITKENTVTPGSKTCSEDKDFKCNYDDSTVSKDLVNSVKLDQNVISSVANETINNKQTKANSKGATKRKGKDQKSESVTDIKVNIGATSKEDSSVRALEEVLPDPALEIKKDVQPPIENASGTCKPKKNNNVVMDIEPSKNKKKSKKQSQMGTKENPVAVTQEVLPDNSQPLENPCRKVCESNKELVCSSVISNVEDKGNTSEKVTSPIDDSEILFDKLLKNTPDSENQITQEDESQSFNNIMVDIISKLDEAILKADADTKELENSKLQPENSKSEFANVQANVQETPDGFKSEIKFTIDNCGVVDNVTREESKEDNEDQVTQTELSSVKPLTRRNTKKSKQLSGKQLKNNTKSSESITKEEKRQKNEEGSSDKIITSGVITLDLVLPEPQKTSPESVAEIEKEVSSEALKEVTPEAKKLVELETISITKLPLPLFKKGDETQVDLSETFDNANVDTQVLKQQGYDNMSLIPIKTKKAVDTTELAKEPQTQTSSDQADLSDLENSLCLMGKSGKDKENTEDQKTVDQPEHQVQSKLNKKGLMETPNVKDLFTDTDTREPSNVVSMSGNNATAVSGSPTVIEIELNESTSLNNVTEDVIKPFLKRSSPNIFTFDNTTPTLNTEKIDQNTQVDKKRESKSVDNKDQMCDSVLRRGTQIKTERAFTAGPSQQNEKSKTTAIEDSASTKNLEFTQTKGKQKKSQSKFSNKKSGKSVIDKTEYPTEERKMETPEREVLSVEMEPDSKKEPILSSEQSQTLPSIKREKSPLLALAPPWMAKLVQGESSDLNKKSEGVNINESSVVSPSEKEAEIVSEAIELGIFGSVKERPKPITTPEEVKFKPETSKKKQKRKGNKDFQVKEDVGQSSIKSSVEEPASKSEDQTLTAENSPNNDSLGSNREENIQSKDIFQQNESNKTIKPKTGNVTKQKLKKADENKTPLKAEEFFKKETEIEPKIKEDKMQQQTKAYEEEIHEVKLAENEIKPVTNENCYSKTTISDGEKPQTNKPETNTEIKSKKISGKIDKKTKQNHPQAAKHSEKIMTVNKSVDICKPSANEVTNNANLPDSSIENIPVKSEKSDQISSENLKYNEEIKEKDHVSKLEGIAVDNKLTDQDFSVLTPVEKTTKVETGCEETKVMTIAENPINTNNNVMNLTLVSADDLPQDVNKSENITEKSTLNIGILETPKKNEIRLPEVTFTEKDVEEVPSLTKLESTTKDTPVTSIPENEDECKGLLQQKQGETSTLVSLNEDSFCSVPKYSFHEIEDAEKKLCNLKNTSEFVLLEGRDDLPTNIESKSDEIKSWAEIAAKDKAIKEEIKEFVPLNTDTLPKPIPIVICVDESADQASSTEAVVEVDPEGFVEFVPKKEIRKRKSRSRSRTRSESEKLNVEDAEVPSTERTSGVNASAPNDNYVGTVPHVTLSENYPELQIKSEDNEKASSSVQLGLTQVVTADSSETVKKLGKVAHEPVKMESSRQLLNVENKSSRSRSRSRSQTHGRKRSRSRKISETEKEVDDILRAWSREDVLQQNIFLDGTFWVDKWKYDDAEKNLYELFNNSSKESLLIIDTNEKHGDDHEDKGPSSGPSSPGPRSSDGKGDHGNRINVVTETLSADLPHGVGAWSDSNTYISDEMSSIHPSEGNISLETPLKTFNGMGDQSNKPNKLTLDVPYGVGACSESIADVSDEKSFNQSPGDNKSVKIPLRPFEGVGDQSSKINIVTEIETAEKPNEVGLYLDSITLVLDEKSSTQPTEENRSPETPLITTSQFTKLSKVTLAVDLESLRHDLAITEEQLRALPTEGVEAMLDALVKCGGDLKTHELTAGCIREGVLVLPQDEETDTLRAEVDKVQERIVVLEQQVEAGKMKLQSCHDTKDKLQKEIGEYRHLMEELEKWVAGIKLMLKTDIHKNNAEEQVLVHQNLLGDLAERQKKLSELRSSCTNLENFEDVKDLASELNSSLALLDIELTSAKNLTEDRLKTLQDLLKVEPELPAPVLTPSPVAATYPVLSPVESPVHEASRDDTIASNVSPIPDEEILVPVLQDNEVPKPELTAQDSGTQTGRSLTLSPEKQIHMEVQTDSPTERPAAVAIQTDNKGWEPKPMPKGKIQILQKVEGNEETIEIATKSNVESNVDPETTRPGEDLSVEIRYKENKEGHEPIVSELNISHLEPQSFETIVMDPGESSTEVIVDADGSKRIVLRKTRKIISHRTMTSGVNMETVDMKPIAFSQVTLQQQQKSVTHTMPDGKNEITTSQGYIGQITSGTQDGTITTAEFSNMPPQVASYQTLPSNVDLQNCPKALEESQLDLAEPSGFTEWTTGSSTVRAVVHQVRRRVIRRTRRIIRKVLIIDGKEHVTEDVVEEPEEVEVSEDGIPRVSIEISKEGQGGMTVQEPFEEDHSLQDAGVEISEILPGDDYDDKLEDKETSPTTVSPPSESHKSKEQLEYGAPQLLSLKNTTEGKRPSVTEAIQISDGKDPELQPKNISHVKHQDPTADHTTGNINSGDKDVNTLFIECEKTVIKPTNIISATEKPIPLLKGEESNVEIKCKTPEQPVTKKSGSPEYMPSESLETLLSSKNEYTSEKPADKTSKKGKKTPDKSLSKKSKQKLKENIPSPTEEIKSPVKHTPEEAKETHPSHQTTPPVLDVTSGLSFKPKKDETSKKSKPSIDEDIEPKITQKLSKRTSKSPTPEDISQKVESSPEQDEYSISEYEKSVKSKVLPKRKNEKKSQKGKSKPDSKTPTQNLETRSKEIPEQQEKVRVEGDHTKDYVKEKEAPVTEVPSKTPDLDEKEHQSPICEKDQAKAKELLKDSPKFIEEEETLELATEPVVVKDSSSKESSLAESTKGTISDLSADDRSKSTMPVVDDIVSVSPSVQLKKDKFIKETSQPASKSLGNIEIEITVKETSGSLKESIPKVASDTKIEPKVLSDPLKETMEIVKQKSDVVLPGVVHVTRELVKKIESPSSSSSSDKSKSKKKSRIPSPEELSTPTSLAESMEIVLPESPNSSDTTKPTHQEIFEMSSPRSDLSQPEESIKTYDTGYEGEDKTTVDESSLKEDDISKSKKKKKRKQKLKEITPDDHSSIEPKSSDFVPSDAVEDVGDIIIKDITSKKSKGKKPAKKTKVDKNKEEIHIAQSAEVEEVAEGSVKDLSDHSASDGIVKIIQESMPTGSSSEAEEFKSTKVLSSVPVLEVLPTQSESVQTTTPVPVDVQPIDTVEISTQVTQSTQEMFAQTSPPEHTSVEAYIQTIPGELVPTTEESAQTLTPKVQSPIETTDSTMQTTKEEKPNQQEEEIQTDEVKFGSLDNVDNSMQTVAEETPFYHEETSQTSPEPEKIQSSSQVISSDLIPTESGESQTMDQSVTTADLSTQIKSSDLIPTHDESIQTVVEENILSNFTQLADKQQDEKPDIVDSKDIVATEKEPVSDQADASFTQSEVIKTVDSMSQTKPVQFKSDSGSDETHPINEPSFKIEIEATVTYGPEFDTDKSMSDLSKSDGINMNEPSKEICAPPSDSTDSDVSSWASHKMRSPSPQTKKGKKSKQRKQKISEGEIVPVIESSEITPKIETVDKEKSNVKPEIKAKITFDVDEYHSQVKPELVAEISQDKNTSGVFIQAEPKPSQKSQSKELLPGFSQTVELEISSEPGHKSSETTKPGKKPKKDRRIRQRTDTRALPEASLVHSHEELRGEHSPGPPERVKEESNDIKTRGSSKISSKYEKEPPSEVMSIQSTLTTPYETKNVEYSLPSSTFDIQFTIHEGSDKLTSEEKFINEKRGNVKGLEFESKEISPQIQSPDDYKTDSQAFIDYESTGDSISSQSEITRDPDVKYVQTRDNSKHSESQVNQPQDSKTKLKSKKSSDKRDEIRKLDVKDANVDSQLKTVGDIISNRVKQAQNPPSILFLTSLEQEEPSTEERANQLEGSLENLQQAVKKHDVIIIQQTIIVTVETISTWLETIEYKIQHTKQSSSHGTVPEQRLEQLEHLQDEIARVESGVAALSDIITQSDVSGQQNIRRVIDSLQQQVATVEETANSTRSMADKDLARWEEFLNGVNNISVLVEDLRSELEALVEDQNTPALAKLKKLEALESTNHSHKAKCAELLTTAHGLLRDFPGRVIPLETYTTQDTIQTIQHNINTEREKLLQLVSLAEEYEQTLKDFAQITDVAEALVDGPIVVSELQHLQEEMQKHRKFFVNLSHCRGILESLEGHLDSETRTKHSALHDELHRRASMILDKAAGRAQQMALAASRWTVLEQGMKEERGWLQVANQRVPDLSSVTTSDYNQYISNYQSLSSDIALHAARASQLVCVAHGLQGLVQSESCAVYDEHHAAILALQAEVNTELGRLLAFRDSWTAYELLSDKLDAWVRSVPMDTTPANMRQFWELKAQFELHKHLKDEAAVHLDTALRVIPVADETLQRQLQTVLIDRWRALEARLDTMQTMAMENLSASSGSVEDKLSRLEREITELATLLADMHGVIKTEEELHLYIERLQVMRGSVDHIMEQLSRLGLLSTAQSDRVSSLLNGARATEMSLREELEMATCLRDRLAALRRGVARVRRDQQRASSVLDQCEASLCENQDTVQQALVNCQGVEETLTTQWGELMSLRQLLHTLPSRLRLSMSPVTVERELTQLQDDHSELTARCRLLYGGLAQRLALWRRFYSQLELVQQSVRETDYMMEILAVQGKVDYERLVKATERLEGLSESLGERESQLEGLRAAAEPLQSSCSPEVAREIEAAVTEVVAAWEDTVTSLQGLCTRYQHAVQLWKQYREASEAISKWADSAADTVDNAKPQQAVEHVRVCEEKLASQQARLSELRDLVAQIAADVGLDPEALLGGEVAALGAKLEDVRETLAALVEAAEDKVEQQERCAEDLREAKDFLTTVQKSLQAVDSSGGEGALEQLTALRNHLIALGKSDGQIQALRDKSADLPPGKQDISVMDILQLWQQVFRETFQQYHRLSARLVRDQEGLEAHRLWQEYLLHVQTFLTSAIPDDYNALSEHQNLCQVHQNLLSSQQSLLLNKPEASVELSVAEQFNSLTNLHNETLARIMEREAQVRNRMNIWDQYRNDHKSLLAWLGETEKEKNRLRLRYLHMRMIPNTIQRIQVMLDKLPVGEDRAEKLGALLQQLCQFCDETLATSLRLEHSAVADKINSMRAALHTWLNFLVGLRELTERYEREVEAVQRTFSDIHVALEDGVVEGAACVPANHQGLQQRLDALKAARERVSAVSTDLEMLGVTQEQLKESLNPVDVKTVSQRVWLLQQQQGELEHQLDMAIYQLEERLRQGEMFDKRAERFLVWAGGVDRRLEGLSTAGVSEPADQLRRLETELEAEVGLRRREADWLRDCGTELVAAEGQEATTRRAQLTNRLSAVNAAWERVQQLTSARANKLRQIIEGMSTLEQRIEELRGWLHSIELQLATPIILEHCTQAGLDKCMAHHDVLTKDIEQHSGPVADVLNHCELLLNDCDSANVQLNTDGISTSMQLLERRWKNVCVLVTERKAKLLRTWQLLQEVLRLCEQQAAWLHAQTEALDRLNTQTDAAQIQALPKLIADVEKVLTEVECQRPALELLQSSYTALATQSSLDSLTTDARSRIAEWSALRSRAEHLLIRLHAAQDRWLRFTEAHGAAVLALTNVDVQLTQIDLLETVDNADAGLDTYKNKLKKLMVLKKELESHGGLLKKADQLGLEVMNSCLPQDVPSVQQMVDEYQLLWKDIMERMKKLIEVYREECRKRNVVNEEVQVETLKFETDTSVQVNTLPAPLLRRDAYIYELQTAIKECNSNLDVMAALEKLTTQNSAKCIAACQSSVDLVRHLSSLLVEQCGASEEQACSTEVEQLEQRYQQLLAQKQAEEREQRELSESGRFTCPLCTRRNWKQLDNDLWRLQKWLEFAEATQAAQTSPPSNINQLEDIIQDYREFLLDLDSHKSLVVSLNTVGRHLAEHTEDEARARDMTQRLAEINQRWDDVCGAAARWETRLQTALLQNPEFHEAIDELVQWMEQTETAIQQMEPVDVADGREVIESKYNKFKDLRHDLEVCEPRVLSLQEAACHLLRHKGSETTDTDACERLTHLRLRLQSLTRLTGSYLLKLGTVLGKDPISHASLATLSHELLDQAAGGASSSLSSTDQLHSNSEGLVDTSVLARGYRFLGRVVRASLPIQALMLVMLGVASLVPITEEDFACSITRGFGPTLRYVNGPPPM